MVQVVREILDPEKDIVRTRAAARAGAQQTVHTPATHTPATHSGKDPHISETDPLAGVTRGSPDAFTLPGLGQPTSLRLRW